MPLSSALIICRCQEHSVRLMNLSNDALFAPGLSQVNETICQKESNKHITELLCSFQKVYKKNAIVYRKTL